MGVPAFFKWLCRKYPMVVVDCIEDVKHDESKKSIPVADSEQNANFEFDNMYLDMNAIIHPCTHPEDKPAPKNEDEMMKAIFEAIDRLFGIIRPKKLVYMAIDGVAPRAKMNQQRSRRFRVAKETQEKKAEIARVREDLKEKGMRLPPKKEEFNFDSNCITPGTPFMDHLSKALNFYIHEKLKNDPAWQCIKLILSDASVPGEGEQKIIDFIRKQRAQPEHNANTQHILFGGDADLLMLGLATHEINFTIIREDFNPNQEIPCEICGKVGHTISECTGLEEGDKFEEITIFPKKKFLFVRLNILKEYLQMELQMDDLPFKYEFDRAIDDWIFMCCFVGNDFLPHLPSLQIRENAIDQLIKLYKRCCYKNGTWLTDSGIVNMKCLQHIMKDLGELEDVIFRNRRRRDLNFQRRNKKWKNDKGRERRKRPDLALLARSNEDDDDNFEKVIDEVRLHEDGFKDRYYESKFEILPNNAEFRKKVATEYAIGLCWVLRYFFQGCPSWKWYYPYHYAPFASDFTECCSLEVEFQLGTPFSPFQQLMGVFPAASRSHVPASWRELMIKSSSTIIDFYPEDFKIDMNGKLAAYLGVTLLPFIDETRLKHALKKVEHQLTKEERKRNQIGDSVMYVGQKHEGYTQLRDMYKMELDKDSEIPFDGKEFDGLAGILLLTENVVPAGGNLRSPVDGLEDIKKNSTVSIKYRNPSYSKDFFFSTKKLEGAIDPPIVLKIDNLVNTHLSRDYRPKVGFNPGHKRASLSNARHSLISHQRGRGNREKRPNTVESFSDADGRQNSYESGWRIAGGDRRRGQSARRSEQSNWRNNRQGEGEDRTGR